MLVLCVRLVCVRCVLLFLMKLNLLVCVSFGVIDFFSSCCRLMVVMMKVWICLFCVCGR